MPGKVETAAYRRDRCPRSGRRRFREGPTTVSRHLVQRRGCPDHRAGSRWDRIALSSSHHLSPIVTHTAPRRHLRASTPQFLARHRPGDIHLVPPDRDAPSRTDLQRPRSECAKRKARSGLPSLADERAPAVLERGDRLSCRDGGGDLVIVPTRLSAGIFTWIKNMSCTARPSVDRRFGHLRRDGRARSSQPRSWRRAHR